MKYNVFIDGAEGTTGLKIHQYFQKREDIQVLKIEEAKRKDMEARLALIRQADISFLCLPDAAAKEIAEAAPKDCRILDTSTAHRTDPEWVYGMPELCSTQRDKIKESNRVAVPGCHATGVILLTRPLLAAGLLPKDYPVAAFSLTGYSGGGKKMIAEYEADTLDPLYVAPRQYGLAQQHKHLREMCAIPGLTHAPVFAPIVANFYSGMETSVALFASQLCPGKTAEDIKAAYAAKYTGPVVTYRDPACDDGFLSAAAMSGKDSMVVSVSGNDERILLTSVFDNLGKGASGAALECLNLVMGREKGFGLDL